MSTEGLLQYSTQSMYTNCYYTNFFAPVVYM